VRVDTTDFLAWPLGPATVAQALVHRPGEGQLLWAAYARVHYYDIPGLDPDGTPRKSVLSRGAGKVGDFLGDVVSGALGSDEGPSDRPPPADLIVWGPAPDCLAHRYVRDIPSRSAVLRRLWTLTPQRLALHTEIVPPTAPEPPREQGLLAKAARVGSGLAKLGREVAEIVADRRMTFGANVEGEPVALPAMEPLAEIPRGQIAGFEVAHRKDTPVLRLRLVDGSGVDFLVGMTDEDECAYASGLANGEPPLRPGARAGWVAKLAEKSLKQAGFLTPGEEILLAATTNLGYAGVQLGRELRVPHTPLGRMPELNVKKLRWPLPAATTREPNGWLDDPTIAFWAQADRADRDAVTVADLLAHTRGVARLVLTRARLTLIAATRLLASPPDPEPPLTAVLDLPPTRVRGVTAELAGRSLPPKPLLRIDFTDGSTLRLRDPIAARQAAVLVGA
jgi:hypothetical protein